MGLQVLNFKFWALDINSEFVLVSGLVLGSGLALNSRFWVTHPGSLGFWVLSEMVSQYVYAQSREEGGQIP